MSTAGRIQRDARISKLARLIGAALSTARARGVITPEELLDVRASGPYGLQVEWRGGRYLVTVQEVTNPPEDRRSVPEALDDIGAYGGDGPA